MFVKFNGINLFESYYLTNVKLKPMSLLTSQFTSIPITKIAFIQLLN